MALYEAIEGHELVVAAFGRWPSFHDGEVHRIVFDRMVRSPSGSYVPTLEIYVRGWIMTVAEDGSGSFIIQNDSVVHFLFEEVSDVKLEGFNQQNVLSSLNLAQIDGPNGAKVLHVELEHCYVFEAEFSARRAKVVDIQPYVASPAA